MCCVSVFSPSGAREATTSIWRSAVPVSSWYIAVDTRWNILVADNKNIPPVKTAVPNTTMSIHNVPWRSTQNMETWIIVRTSQSSNINGGTRLDIAANGFWGGRFERTFVDVRVFNPFSKTNRNTTLRKYIWREVKHAVLT